MTENPNRIGRFTSSKIAALLTKSKDGGFGVPAMTYILEKRFEKLLGTSINDEKTARSLSWGKLLERFVFEEKLGISYTLSSTETDLHPTLGHIWAGSKDGTHEIAERAVIDIKCPFTKKSFCQLAMPLYCGYEGIAAMNAIREGFTHKNVPYPPHKDAETYYWQLVSNVCINNTEYAELVVYMPYESDMPQIRQFSDGDGNAYWMQWAQDNELPFLKDDGYFNDLNIIRFKVPEEDKKLLTERVEKAGKLLEDNPQILIASHDEEVGAMIIEPEFNPSKLIKIA